MEQYTRLLDYHALQKWRTFLTGAVSGLPGIVGGQEQWVKCEKVFETSPEAVALGTNWRHSVKHEFGEKLPRYLVELWVGEEFAGEYLLPKLADLTEDTQHTHLWKMDTGNGPQLTRPDYRKKTVRHTHPPSVHTHM